nr:hypothetical protein [Methyloceanibacter methanicus]
MALFSSDRFTYKLAIRNSFIMLSSQADVVVPTHPPIRPLTLASSSDKRTLLPLKLKPSISAQVTSIVAKGSKKVPPVNEPKR